MYSSPELEFIKRKHLLREIASRLAGSFGTPSSYGRVALLSYSTCFAPFFLPGLFLKTPPFGLTLIGLDFLQANETYRFSWRPRVSRLNRNLNCEHVVMKNRVDSNFEKHNEFNTTKFHLRQVIGQSLNDSHGDYELISLTETLEDQNFPGSQLLVLNIAFLRAELAKQKYLRNILKGNISS